MRSLLLTVVTVTSLVGAHIPAAGSPPDSEVVAKVDALAAKAIASSGAVGLSIAVARGDRVILEKGYGIADVEFAIPVSADSIFRIGSVTKQFSAAAIMLLVEQGKLKLDDPIQKFLPDFPEKEFAVTIRHLLTHTSGIWNYTEDGTFMARDASLELSPTELIATFKDKPLEFEPGTKFHYSNSAYYLLGPIIEKASGKTYAAFVLSELAEPLGLKHTRHESNGEIILGRAQGYSLRGGRLANDRPIGADVPGAAGSLLSTAGDLVRWEIALVNGKVVSADSFQQMATSAVLNDNKSDNKSTGYGFGLGIGTFEGRPRMSHGGGIFGFNSYLLTLPPNDELKTADDRITVAIIANVDSFNSKLIADDVTRIALGVKVFEPKDLVVTPTLAQRYCGEYAFQGIPLEIVLVERDGKIWAKATGQSENRLLYQGDSEFRATFDPTVKFVFPESSADEPAGTPAGSFVLFQGGGEIPAKRKVGSNETTKSDK